MPTVIEMLKLGEVDKDDVVYDVGCGDGRLLITAVQRFNAKHTVGIEINRKRAQLSRRNVRKLGLGDRIEVINKDVFDCSLEPATVVTLYLFPCSNERLRPKLEEELSDEARVVCNSFRVERWKPSITKTIKLTPDEVKEYNLTHNFPRDIHLYRMKEVRKELSDNNQLIKSYK
jgi:precorrin-6B methylase 2